MDNNINENILNKLIHCSDPKLVNELIAHSTDWQDTILPALHELKRLIASGMFNDDKNKQYLNKILTLSFISIFYLGNRSGHTNEEIEILERMLKL